MSKYTLPSLWRKPKPKPKRSPLEIIGPNGAYALAAVGILGLGIAYAKSGKKPAALVTTQMLHASQSYTPPPPQPLDFASFFGQTSGSGSYIGEDNPSYSRSDNTKSSAQAIINNLTNMVYIERPIQITDPVEKLKNVAFCREYDCVFKHKTVILFEINGESHQDVKIYTPGRDLYAQFYHKNATYSRDIQEKNKPFLNMLYGLIVLIINSPNLKIEAMVLQVKDAENPFENFIAIQGETYSVPLQNDKYFFFYNS